MAITQEIESTTFSSDYPVPLWLNGKEVSTSNKLEVISPLTGKPVHSASAASVEDVHAAVAAAKAALPAWSATKPSERRDLLLRAADEFERRRGDLWYFCKYETGSTPGFHDFDFKDMIENLRSTAGLIGSVTTATAPVLGQTGRSGMVVVEPYGVVVAIAPWNAPCILGSRSFVGPLAMGNTVILKGSEYSPGLYWALADVFHSVGLPAGVLNTLYNRLEDAAQVTEALIVAPEVKKINFCGSTMVGSIIAGLAGKHLKPVLTELGGKAPAIVCEDADLENAALHCTLGAFLNSGQICMSTERILVNRKIYEPFKVALKAAIDQIFDQDPEYVCISSRPVEKVRKMIFDAVEKGANTVHGDLKETFHLATRMRPIVLEDVKKGMDLYHQESFGPTVSLFVVDNDEEAIHIANDTDYGLASSVFTEDLRRGLKIARSIETGAVHINSMSVHDESCMPHGGAKKSGWGRFNGVEGLKEWVRTKNVTWKD
ncbi:hypothetical protein AAFC00_001938 [Neodothiora populina]|uniref:Aldehyde dehydrogenase domain-containing protein n=1 Tax=Neodothiora populina TaxID=2781224 RepID=A0ABR3PQM6_9PEZI